MRHAHRMAGKLTAVGLAASAAAGSLATCLPAWAAPAGGQVTAGAGAINATANSAGGTSTVIRQNSNRLAINWTSFDIGAKDTVTFAQPSSSAIALNRVTSQSATQILGTLNANGQVFILNPNGVLFGKSAQVNVGGLLATTLSLSDSDFLAGTYRFTDSGGTGSIVNEGQITANGGYIAFIAPHVSNQGTLVADNGTVELAAGAAATVTLAGNQLVSLTIDQGTLDALAENGDLIRADGGVVILTSKGRDAVLSGVVNNTGEIQARTAANVGGTIKLLADGGTALAGGTLDASAPDGGNGGTIETSGQAFQLLSGATITTRAASGKTGTWLIDPSDITVASSGGSMTGASLASQLASTNVQLQTSTGTGGNGDITISDNVAWSSGNTLTLTADRNIDITGTLNAGTTGSLVANATGNVTLAGAFTGLALTATSSTGNIALSAPITLNSTSGTLTLSAAGTITPDQNASITTGTFDLASGQWVQVGSGSVASFSASNFEVTGGSFLRALSGSGTTAAPYLIGDVYGLQGIGTSPALLADAYRLANSIDASGTANWNSSAGFAPIGSVDAPFTGAFDGNGKTISGLTINLPSTEDVGLFGFIKDGSVSNLSLTNFTVVGSRFVGALAGINEGGTISGVSVDTGAVTGTSNTWAIDDATTNVGGLVGENLDDGATIATIANSSTGLGVTVTASDGSGGPLTLGQVGGLVGLNANGTITSSWSAASVTGDRFVGGLAGRNDGTVSQSFASGVVDSVGGYVGGLVGLNTGTITDSYALGSVTGPFATAGLVGQNMGTITNSYAAGLVQGGSGVAGGLVAVGVGTATNSYWNTDTTGQSTSNGGTGLTNAQMLASTAASFTGFDFSSVWRFIPGTSYPYLASIFTSTPTVFSGSYTDTSGTIKTGSALDFAANDSLIGRVVTGANGFYYLMLPSTTFSNGTTAVAVFSPSGSGTTFGAAETSGASVAMNLQDNVVALGGTSVSLGDIAAALGNPFSGGTVSEVASLLPSVLTNLQSNALSTASGVSLVFNSGTTLDLSGDTTISASQMTFGSVSGSGSTLTLQTSGGDITQSGAFTLGVLGVTSAGNVTLDGANQIGTVAADVSGAFSLDNAASLTVGQVGSTAGITAGGAVTLSAAGNALTLAQGITSSASGDAVVLASSAFTNLAGSSAITASNGRWLVSSSSPDADTFGGLQSGNDALWGQSFSVGSTVAASGNRYLFSTDQVILVNAIANQKVVGTTAQESATLSLKYAGSNYGNAFTDASVPAGVSVIVYSNGDAASATRANGDDGVGRYRIRYSVSGLPVGYTVADGQTADLTVTGSTSPAVVDQVNAIANSDADSGASGNGTQRRREAAAVAAAFGTAQQTIVVANDRRSSALPAWPVAAACAP
ncbi:filamentous hemagglutinin N-terminal domain-containing protein [Trinickia violacea]|uniref:Filamentous hemagglutinin N-terminal domain-containing protein n=1 Tax=Trinickia violacea TaxID=2571746 RepID=A0A4P8IUM7_9BURK|nr:filamentous hemagglutinin N-terminal domain-containing protein [Trinickia violacea]QCP52096.1 filamentous hemagglutinin N-terminal domain-containing protein [Trinickia violacea]